MHEAFLESIDELNPDSLENAVEDFLGEQELLGEWLVWIEKWKALHKSETLNPQIKPGRWEVDDLPSGLRQKIHGVP